MQGPDVPDEPEQLVSLAVGCTSQALGLRSSTTDGPDRGAPSEQYSSLGSKEPPQAVVD